MSTDIVAQTLRNSSVAAGVFCITLETLLRAFDEFQPNRQHLGIRPAPVYLSADKRMRGINMHSNDNPKSSHPFMI